MSTSEVPTNTELFAEQACNLIRAYYVQILDPQDEVMGTYSFPSLNALIQWALDEKLRRLSEIEEHI